MPVAPFTGAWIEIAYDTTANSSKEVAPFTGAWIEIRFDALYYACYGTGRTLHGCVD